MITLSWSTIIEIATAIGAIGAAWQVIQRIYLNFKRKKQAYRDAIIAEAVKEMEQVKEKLEVRIKDLEVELANQKESVSKDMSHLREMYKTELKALGEKIENLRQDLTAQYQTVGALLTQLVNKK